jgi:formylglycine-generating enzyme
VTGVRSLWSRRSAGSARGRARRRLLALALAWFGGLAAQASGAAQEPAADPGEAAAVPGEAAALPGGGVTVRSATPCATAPPGWACVPGGVFVRGVDQGHACEQADQPRGRRPSEVPARRVFVDTFYLELTEVTVEAYARCVASSACRDVAPVYADFDAPRQPMTAVSWYDAVAYCEAQGTHLPTEAQWELAARGHDGALNPWGDEPASCERAVIMDERGRSCGVPQRSSQAEAGRVLEVASRPSGRFGLFDLVGNAEEWVAEWWSEDWEACGAACQGEDPRGPCAGAEPCPGHRWRVVRGGSWYWPAEHASGGHRRRARPANDPPHHYGFRCAASPEEARALLEAAGGAGPPTD